MRHFPSKNENAVIDRTVDLVLWLSATLANPNGDPLTGKPRQLLDGRGVISDVCLKSRERETEANLFGSNLFVTRRSVLNDKIEATDAVKDYDAALKLKDIQKKIAKAEKDKEKEKIKDLKQEKAALDKVVKKGSTEKSDGDLRDEKNLRLVAELARRHDDLRKFGGVLASQNCPVRGVIHIGFGVSQDKIEIVHTKLVPSYVVSREEKEKGADNTMGDKFLVGFGLYRFDMHVSPNQAEKLSCTWGDLEKFVTSLQYLCSHTMAANRVGMAFERLDIFLHDKKCGSAPSELVMRACRAERNARSGSIDPTSVADYDFSVAKVAGVEHACVSLADMLAEKAA